MIFHFQSLCIIAACLSSAPLSAQSFDCHKATTTTEKLICANKPLGDLDQSLAAAIKETIAKSPERKQRLLSEEREWVVQRDKKCAGSGEAPSEDASTQFIGCLTRAYLDRIKALRTGTGASDNCADKWTGSTRCGAERFSQADGDLNDAYRRAISALKAGKKDTGALVQSEKTWIARRDVICGEQGEKFGSAGKVGDAFVTECKISWTKDRTAWLRAHVGGTVSNSQTSGGETYLDCASPASEFQAIACSATDDASLRAAFDKKLAEWKPVANWRVYAPRDLALAQQQLDNRYATAYANFTKSCDSFECHQAQIADALRLNAFPAEAFGALTDYASNKGAATPLLTSQLWKLSHNEAQPALGIADGRVYWYGPKPSWLTSGKAPFLGRDLQEWERQALANLIQDSVVAISQEHAEIAGIDDGILRSAGFNGGGSARCSDNPLYSSIDISETFPSTTWKRTSFKLLRPLSTAVSTPTPTCAFDDPYPDGFFPATADHYLSTVEIDGLSQESYATFVRPDGTFWLHLSDGNWYRFRRDMTSNAPEIGTKYRVITKTAFDTAFKSSKTISDLEMQIKSMIAGDFKR